MTLRSSSSLSTIPMKTIVSNANFSMELFDGTSHIDLLQGEVLDTLFRQGLDITIKEEKHEEMKEKQWNTIVHLTYSMIQSCFSGEQKYNFKNETSVYTVRKELEKKFLKKNSQNHLYMKKRLFIFDYQPDTTMNVHVTTFNQLVTDLVSLDKTFKTEDLTFNVSIITS